VLILAGFSGISDGSATAQMVAFYAELVQKVGAPISAELKGFSER